MTKNFLKRLTGTRLAIRRDAAEILASSDFGTPSFLPSNEVNQENNVTMRDDGIAVIHVDGVLTYRSDLLTAIYGNDTYNSIERAFRKCLEDGKCKGIVFDVDSPGGEVSGCSDLSELIFRSRGSKPAGIVARTGGTMCSAAYWIASACEKVYTSAQGTVGSIGVLCSFEGKTDEDVQVVVSDLSPNKNPDPKTPEGIRQITEELNDLAGVFVDAVARNRGVSREEVLSRFGMGGVFVGVKAQSAGLTDGVLDFEEMIRQMKQTEEQMSEEKKDAANVDVAAVKQAAVAEERARVAGIGKAFKGLGMDAECENFVAEGKSVAEAVEFCLEKAKAKLSEMEAGERDGSLTDAQREAIRKGLAAEASAQNFVRGGFMNGGDGAKDRLFKAFRNGANNFNANRSKQ